MKKLVCVLVLCTLFFVITNTVAAQCSICTKTASQLGEKAGKGLNTGILYLMLTPFAVGGFIGLRWWKQEKSLRQKTEE
ncbi:MAG TPA: hypothetical protein VHB70_08310 [Parafilimonas sp.]|nr:hypothetical protein [Parafilimonas sp.]